MPFCEVRLSLRQLADGERERQVANVSSLTSGDRFDAFQIVLTRSMPLTCAKDTFIQICVGRGYYQYQVIMWTNMNFGSKNRWTQCGMGDGNYPNALKRAICPPLQIPKEPDKCSVPCRLGEAKKNNVFLRTSNFRIFLSSRQNPQNPRASGSKSADPNRGGPETSQYDKDILWSVIWEEYAFASCWVKINGHKWPCQMLTVNCSVQQCG